MSKLSSREGLNKLRKNFRKGNTIIGNKMFNMSWVSLDDVLDLMEWKSSGYRKSDHYDICQVIVDLTLLAHLYPHFAQNGGKVSLVIDGNFMTLSAIDANLALWKAFEDNGFFTRRKVYLPANWVLRLVEAKHADRLVYRPTNWLPKVA